MYSTIESDFSRFDLNETMFLSLACRKYSCIDVDRSQLKDFILSALLFIL